jgi:hypothetical protein
MQNNESLLSVVRIGVNSLQGALEAYFALLQERDELL